MLENTTTVPDNSISNPYFSSLFRFVRLSFLPMSFFHAIAAFKAEGTERAAPDLGRFSGTQKTYISYCSHFYLLNAITAMFGRFRASEWEL